MLYPEQIIEEVRLRNDIVEVVSGYVKLEKKGRSYWGLCPFHNEKTPSFSVEPNKQFFYCFGCNKGGSVIHFIMNIENLEFVEALKFLADRAGIALPETEDPQEREKAEQRKVILEINRQAARFYFRSLAGKDGLKAQNYLKKRGLLAKTIKQFGLGYAPAEWDGLTRELLKQHFPADLLIKSGLSIRAKSGELVDRFRDRIMFPIFDIRGNIVGFGGRVLDGSMPKYMNSPDTPVYNKSRELYGLNYARMSPSKRLLIVEGYMDVISLHQAGIDFAVASLGTALTRMQAWILKKYSEEVIIAYDSDSAGQAATMRGLDILEETGCNVKVLILPEGKDPDEYIRIHGPDKFKNLIDRAISLLDYKIRVQRNMHNLDTLEDKLKLLNGIADTLAEHDNPIERELYAKNYAQEYGISYESLLEEINRRASRKSRSGDYSRSVRDGRDKLPAIQNREGFDARYSELEHMLLVLLCHENRFFNLISQNYDLESFRDRQAGEIARKLYRKLEENKSCVLAELLNDLDPGSAGYLVRLSETKGEVKEPEKAIRQILYKLEILKLEDLQKQTIERIKNEQDGEIRQQLGLEFSIRAEKIAELKKKL
ncbi:MAG TPA: DNA primase [Thermoclostridium caenicola]|uniref:DNA primase n=1 Tax=Thermoclostridium caenicola TaxID=659425 RepID=A0A1M6GIW9_9FIRM|nr:DNA primase [Thermoclostridium caenicola]SHJ09894.1 DNA primase [Thermoclostridium caenicola]HOK42076.1 DNA primase [Thermoclostridium caenicola]HOL85241.1 DNA primase [Thermoclostridium caenicola]HOP71813.1 DNA primase [Thermoclostridium caenicola]HPO75638.1 DNA primase [Thermoclostridium caenicola]